MFVQVLVLFRTISGSFDQRRSVLEGDSPIPYRHSNFSLSISRVVKRRVEIVRWYERACSGWSGWVRSFVLFCVSPGRIVTKSYDSEFG